MGGIGTLTCIIIKGKKPARRFARRGQADQLDVCCLSPATGASSQGWRCAGNLCRVVDLRPAVVRLSSARMLPNLLSGGFLLILKYRSMPLGLRTSSQIPPDR